MKEVFFRWHGVQKIQIFLLAVEKITEYYVGTLVLVNLMAKFYPKSQKQISGALMLFGVLKIQPLLLVLILMVMCLFILC